MDGLADQKGSNHRQTLTLSNKTGHVEEALMPNLSSFFPILRPGVSLSRTKHVIPLYPWGGGGGGLSIQTTSSSNIHQMPTNLREVSIGHYKEDSSMLSISDPQLLSI